MLQNILDQNFFFNELCGSYLDLCLKHGPAINNWNISLQIYNICPYSWYFWEKVLDFGARNCIFVWITIFRLYFTISILKYVATAFGSSFNHRLEIKNYSNCTVLYCTDFVTVIISMYWSCGGDNTVQRAIVLTASP